MIWTPDRIAELQRLLDEGLTFVAIGERMGLTKNQCIGNATRMGMKPSSEATLTQAQISSRGGLGRNRPASTLERLDALQMIFPPSGHCQFGIGADVKAPGFHFCGDPGALPGAPYCRVHLKLCHLSKSAFEARSAAWTDERKRQARVRLQKTAGR